MTIKNRLNRPDKNHPSAEWIAELRRRYTVESSIDQLLSRKLARRAGPGYSPVTLAQLTHGVSSLLHSKIGSDFVISEARWLSGGASKLQMAFTLSWDRPEVGRESTAMVLRMEPAESIVETSRLREFQLIKAMAGVVPVPTVFWCDEGGEFLPYPALICSFATGVTKPSNAASNVSGAGTQLTPELRRILAPQFTSHLAAIHSHDWRKAELSAFDIPNSGTQCAAWGLDWWERVWEEDSDEDIPLLRVAANWLRRNMPELQAPVIVHSDYRLGNFLFTEHDAKITAWLDWELGRIGDRHQDLAWTTSRAFANLDSDGKTVLVCGMLPEAEFLDAYERASGFSVNVKSLQWYKIYNNYSLAILLIGSGYRVASNGKTHQDVLISWLMGLGSMILDQMRVQLEEEA
ncbi:MAG: phosphotransferase family protein [Zhongshania sp.]|uniref:phosphotransferase family protein n=1 Tax=Zhongshania sp. TaxID=1971902 RepID=UPI002621C0F8|nr:phosphotransferase family protein [Zhongshania sp.]MDF1693559.1 phosphotransferase family protein [Zhongshania sp.]